MPLARAALPSFGAMGRRRIHQSFSG